MIALSYEQSEDLGLKYVRDLLEPVCPYGVRRLRAEGFYDAARRDALERELDNVALLCAALEADERAVLDLRHALSALKDLSGIFPPVRAARFRRWSSMSSPPSACA